MRVKLVWGVVAAFDVAVAVGIKTPVGGVASSADTVPHWLAFDCQQQRNLG
jgi:hypothetical protein